MTRDESQLVLRSVDELKEFVRSWGWMQSRRSISLDLSCVNEHERVLREGRLNFWRQVCGCQLGVLLLIATLVWRLAILAHTSHFTLGALAKEVGIALMVAVLGKMFAMVGAKLLLAADVALFARRVMRTTGDIVRN